MKNEWHHTTVLAVRRNDVVALGSDGQVTLGTTVIKQGAAKVRRLAGGKVLAGFAGSVADALALFTRFEAKLEEYGHNLERAAVELARDWRTDKALRHLEAMLITADHGNAEQLHDGNTGQAHTAHTVNPVPLIYVGRPANLAESGALCDIAPTMLTLMGLNIPEEMRGHNLVTLATDEAAGDDAA